MQNDDESTCVTTREISGVLRRTSAPHGGHHKCRRLLAFRWPGSILDRLYCLVELGRPDYHPFIENPASQGTRTSILSHPVSNRGVGGCDG